MIDFRIAAIAATLVAAPAAAATVPPAASTVAVAAQTAVVGTAPQQARDTRYCIVETPTGSYISRKFCHTRDAWFDMGTDLGAR